MSISFGEPVLGWESREQMPMVAVSWLENRLYVRRSSWSLMAMDKARCWEMLKKGSAAFSICRRWFPTR